MSEPTPSISPDTLLAFAENKLSLRQLAQQLNLSVLETTKLLDDHQDDLNRLKKALDLEYHAKLQAMANTALTHLGEIANGQSTLPLQARKACTDILRIHTSVMKKAALKASGQLQPAVIDELIMNARYKSGGQGFSSVQLAQIDRANLALEKVIRAAARGPVRYNGLPEVRIDCKAA